MDFTGERYVPDLKGQIKYEHLHRYAVCLQFAAGKSVLDIASGEGYGAALLATVAKSVMGVDIDLASVEQARHIYYNPSLNYVVGSCDSVPLPDASFDVVTSFETIEHHDKHDEMLDEIKRVLKPGGTLIISSPNRLTYSDEPGYKNPFHVKELYYDEFYELLRRRFKSIRIFGQRLAAGSFVFPLGTMNGNNLKPLTGDASRVTEQVCELPSAIYFVAVCSDDPRIEERDISSVYLDRSDDLLKTLERERVHDIRRMQEQVRRTEEEIALNKRGYEADIARLRTQVLSEIDELNETKASHAERLRERDRTIVERDDLIAQLRAHLLVSEKNVRDHQENIRAYQRLLSEAQAQLSRHVQVLNWIHASRSWRISSTLRLVDRLNDLRPRAREVFSGQLELPQSVVFDVLEIRGWVYSTAAPVMLVEAFLDDFYLGSVRYGERRPEISGAPLECGYSDRISLHGFSITGEKTLRIRVFDQKGNRQVYTRRLIVTPASQTAVEPSIPLEIFRGTLELPQPEAVLSDSVEIRGWAYSKAGSIVHIEAFFNDSYLGRIAYGQERPDVFAALPAEAPLGCGYNQSLSLSGSNIEGQKTLKLSFYDEKGNTQTVERPVTIELPTVAAGEAQARQRAALVLDAGDPRSANAIARSPKIRPPLQLEHVIAEFQGRMGRDPSILDWNSGFNLHGSLPHLAIFSPPLGSNAGTLPYLDHSIDIVLTSSSDPTFVAEARRVAAAAFVRVVKPDSLEVDWKTSEEESQLQTTSIIIPVYNGLNYTQSCLAELRKTLPHNFRGEIIVVDDASSDETQTVLKEFEAMDQRVKVLRNSENSGFITSCNRAAKEASGDIIIFLNNDTLPRPGWLPPLLRVLRDKPDAGAVGGKLVYPDGTLQEAGAVIFSDGSGYNFGKYDKASNAPLYSFLREVDYCSAALLATPRALFLELGGFDTRFQPAYYEDADYCFALRARGYRVYYQPESVVVHFEGASSGTDITTGVKSYQAVNRGKFVEKWSDTLPHQPHPPQRYDFASLQDLALSRANCYAVRTT